MKNQVILIFALCVLFTACTPKMQPGTTSDANSTTENIGQTTEDTNLPKSQNLLKADDKVIEATMQR